MNKSRFSVYDGVDEMLIRVATTPGKQNIFPGKQRQPPRSSPLPSLPHTGAKTVISQEQILCYQGVC